MPPAEKGGEKQSFELSHANLPPLKLMMGSTQLQIDSLNLLSMVTSGQSIILRIELTVSPPNRPTLT